MTTNIPLHCLNQNIFQTGDLLKNINLYQSWTEALQEKRDQYPLWTWMQKSSMKCYQTKFNSLLKIFIKWPSRIYYWNARIIKYMKIDQCDEANKMKVKKPTWSFKLIKKSDKIQHPPFHDKNTQQTRNRQRLSKHNESNN